MGYENGRLPASALRAIPGGRLEKGAAKSWLAMRYYIGRKRKLWLEPTGPNSSYRSLDTQRLFWSLHQQGKMPQAVAYPGRSNHGWGKAVDVATPSMAGAIRQYGHRFGWGIAGGVYASDAPSEWWHTVKVASGPWTAVWYSRYWIAKRRKGRRA